MADWTTRWLKALKALKVNVVDQRGALPVHATRVFGSRSPAALLGHVSHHSAGDHDGVPALKAMAEWHISREGHIAPGKGAPGICYTGAVSTDGTYHLLWGLEVAPWSQGYRQRPGDENAEFLSTVFLGFFSSPSYPDHDEPTVGQLRTQLAIVQAGMDVFAWNEGDFYGHFDFGKPACPGATLEALIRSIRRHAPPMNHPSISALDTVEGKQEALRHLGLYSGPVDGLWGYGTKKALMEFQRRHDLVVDGLWGPNTQRVMSAVLLAEV